MIFRIFYTKRIFDKPTPAILGKQAVTRFTTFQKSGFLFNEALSLKNIPLLLFLFAREFNLTMQECIHSFPYIFTASDLRYKMI